MHSKLHTKVDNLAVKMAKRLDMSLETLLLLAKYHDIGKTKISKDILFKKGPLTDKEWQEIKLHPQVGYQIAQNISKLKHIAEAILYHHERWDGKGYPHGLKGEEIPIEARVMAIIDSYDAMTTDRPYQKAKTKEEALKELEQCAGTQFDPELTKIFIQELKN